MDCSVDQVLEAREAVRTRHAIGLASNEGEDEASLEDVLGSEDHGYERVEVKLLLSEALEALDQDDREIVILRYREELSQSQIAAQIGCSQTARLPGSYAGSSTRSTSGWSTEVPVP